MRHLFLVLGIVVLSAGSVAAQQKLRDVKSIDDAVFDVAVADKIRKECPEISARVVRALNLYRKTRAEAKALGFTDAEIKAYGDSEAEKARMRAKGEAYLRRHGVVASDPQSYCAVGRKEIQKSSRIGSLLREK
ncbi:DUF5333 domain-containing protein [uncultured Sulfitobacter sp.]|uniref:DUF5333 domain-containing protein n=1 Tax=uncultured Sulfitobacter sp. TaxID=191468 RepID=UPI0026022379|nr:DUF5333 domain-containing protein [uncultured Sulfitobacter sp.]